MGHAFAKRRGPGAAPRSAWLRKLTGDSSGTSAVEFALVTPIFLLLLGAVVDFGGAMYAKFNLNSAVSAAANYALNNASSVNATSGAALASGLSAFVASAHAANWASATVTVNNGSTATTTAGTTTTSGTASNATYWYCPTGSGAAFAWGAPVLSGSTCSSGVPAGQFVVISASATYAPILGFMVNILAPAMSASAVVQVQ